MELNEFKAGVYRQQYQYKSFTPAFLNHEWKWSDNEINTLLKEANSKLDELNNLSHSVSNMDNHLDMFITTEALSSCKIEGAKIDLNDVISGSTEATEDKNHELEDVHNYIEALQEGIKDLKRLPLSTRVFNNMHMILMNNERGEKKTPGEYRKSQNWVGGKTLKEALYIPPGHEELHSLISDLENFIHNEEIDVPHLIKLAIVHYQFLTIHPYLDGNGKIARLIVPLFMYDFGLLLSPVLNLSEQFEKSKTEYLVKLSVARDRDAMDLWIKYFLNSINKAAELGIIRLNQINELKKKIDTEILLRNGQQYVAGENLTNLLFRESIISSGFIKQNLKLADEDIETFLKLLSESGIITNYGKSSDQYILQDYNNIFSNR